MIYIYIMYANISKSGKNSEIQNILVPSILDRGHSTCTFLEQLSRVGIALPVLQMRELGLR
jgi:hypothetical protein